VSASTGKKRISSRSSLLGGPAWKGRGKKFLGAFLGEALAYQSSHFKLACTASFNKPKDGLHTIVGVVGRFDFEAVANLKQLRRGEDFEG